MTILIADKSSFGFGSSRFKDSLSEKRETTAKAGSREGTKANSEGEGLAQILKLPFWVLPSRLDVFAVSAGLDTVTVGIDVLRDRPVAGEDMDPLSRDVRISIVFQGPRHRHRPASTRGRIQTICGNAFSGSTPRSAIALATVSRGTWPCSESAKRVAMAVDSASTSKNRRSRSRESLRPKPSVPSVINPPGTQGAIWSGTIFMKSDTATNTPSSFSNTVSR